MKKYALILFGVTRREPVFCRQYAGQRRWPHMGAGNPRTAEGRSHRCVTGRPVKRRTLCAAAEDTGELQDFSPPSSDDEIRHHPFGQIHIGMDDKLDEKKGSNFALQGFAAAPARINHCAWASEDTVVQVHTQRPFYDDLCEPSRQASGLDVSRGVITS
jgi:hypothetical protein